jgi:glycosyltransferase involved in cell wall biosynthesis
MLKLSLIIPVYNEERHISACLDAVALQTVMPTEVIVVDNNCTDRTVEIASGYKFVRVIYEPRQGRGNARSAGFNAAKGDIIGRIDADSRIHPDWTAKVINRFDEDSDLAGLTGMSYTPFLPFVISIKTTLFSRAYYWFAHAAFDTVTMWGANMALRRLEWQKIRKDVILDDSVVHEDQDMSLWIAADGGKIVQDNSLLMTTDEQSYQYFPKLIHYARLYESTKSVHKKNGNLSNPKMLRVGFLRTLPGRLAAYLMGIPLFFISLLLFPVYYFYFKKVK